MKRFLIILIGLLFFGCNDDYIELPRGACLERCINIIIDNTTDADHYNQDLPLKAYEVCNKIYPENENLFCGKTYGNFPNFSFRETK